MKTEYVVNGFIAFSEKDNFENGCLPDTARTHFVNGRDWTCKGETLQELVDNLSEEFRAADIADFLFDSCDEDGRLDLQLQQNKPFQVGKPSQKTIEEWKTGKRDLWFTCYSFIVEKRVSGFSLESERSAGLSTNS